MNIKMIVTDLDRTLLREDKTISDYTVNVLSSCREHGIKVVFATARSIRRAQEFVQKVTIDALIAVNGAVIYQGEAKIKEHVIPEQAKHDILWELSEGGVKKIAAETETCVYSNHHAPDCDIVKWDFAENVPEPICRISVHHDDPEYIRSIVCRHEVLQLYTVYGEDLFDIDPAEAGKWNGIQFLSEYFSISTAEIATFGDDVNDIEMLRGCGVGVAVANAVDEVIAAADFICDTNDNDGVAKWIEKRIKFERRSLTNIELMSACSAS